MTRAGVYGYGPASKDREMDHMTALKIGIAGLGRMGGAMAERLVGQGFEVAGWRRSGVGPQEAATLKITACETLAALAAASDIVILALLDDEAVDAVLSGLVDTDIAGRLIVDTSTVSPQTLTAHQAAFAARGACLIDAPIAGGPDMVRIGSIGLYIGGDAADVARFMPVAEALSGRILHVGPLGHGAAGKLVNNMMLLGYWQCLKEALLLGQKCGLDRDTMIGLLSGSPAASGAFKARIPVILGQTDAVGFSIAGALKDARLVDSVATALDQPIPAMRLAQQSFEAMVAAGYSAADLAVMVRHAVETTEQRDRP
ncbi:NAD(P)-dependent oxidoreductase [Rhizobium halophytocola]|nr:NAD(P)-dependent oxidoreductase [Rhizobium halophytocola]